MLELLRRSPLVLVLCMGIVPIANCSCDDHSITVVDTFGPDVDGDRLHQYAAGGSVEFIVYGSGVVQGAVVSSSDDSVFWVASVVPREAAPLLQQSQLVLDVTIEGVSAGSADLLVSNDGEVVEGRTLTFVDVEGVLFTRPVGLPGILEVPVAPTDFVIGERGADFLVHYFAQGDDDVHGLDVLRPLDSGVAIGVQNIGGDFSRTERNFVHIDPGAAPIAVRYTLAGVLVDEPIVAVPGVVATADFVRKRELRALFADRDLPPEYADILAAGTDERVICDGESCAAKIEPKDADGRVVFGAAVDWQVPGLEDAQAGDILTFNSGSTDSTVRAVVAQPSGQIVVEDLTVRADSDTLLVVNSTTAASCASVGKGGASVFAVVLLLLRRRRTR
jgi:hypothetical protein